MATPCPNHEGNYDCTPFCARCEGEQEIMDSYWITESTTYKIWAESEEQAREIWNRYWEDGEDVSKLDMKTKGIEIEADWQWMRED